MAELSTKPYLVRAIHEWCTDSGYRPHIAVVVDERTVVPREFVRNGEIVLNVSAMATNRLQISNELIEFEARFGGVARHVSIPIDNVSAIYAQETGHGMAFEVPKALALVPGHQGGDSGVSDDASPSAVGADEGGVDSAAGSGEAARARRRPRLTAVPSPAPESEPPKAAKRRRKDGKSGEDASREDGTGERATGAGATGAGTADEAAGGSAADTRTASDAGSPGPDSVPTAGEPGIGARGASRQRGPRSRATTHKNDVDGKAGTDGKVSADGKTGADADSSAPSPGDEPSPPRGGRPRLTRVK